MQDREKVIKGIQECDLNGGLIGNCPYKSIIALLKEQDAFEPKQIFVKEGHSRIVQIICPCCGKKIGCDISVDTEGRRNGNETPGV